MGRESQLARVWALDGARHTALKSPAGAIVSRRVRGFMGSVIGGCGGVRFSVVTLAPVWCGPRRELATPLKCQVGALEKWRKLHLLLICIELKQD